MPKLIAIIASLLLFTATAAATPPIIGNARLQQTVAGHVRAQFSVTRNQPKRALMRTKPVGKIKCARAIRPPSPQTASLAKAHACAANP